MFFFAKNQHDVCPNSKKAHKTFEKHYNISPICRFCLRFLIILFVLFFGIQEHCITFATE